MELKTIIIILELTLLFGIFIMGISIGFMLKVAEKVYDWRH